MSEEQVAKPRRKEILYSKEFRTVPVSSITLGVNDNFAQVTCGIELISGDHDIDQVQQEVRLVMTPRTMKVFSLVLATALKQMEANGVKVELPPGKEAELTDPGRIKVTKTVRVVAHSKESDDK